MTDSKYRAYGFPDEPGESRYIPAKEGKYRPATKAEIRLNMRIDNDEYLEAIIKAKVCYMHEDGESFLIDNMERFNSIIIEKILREL